MHSKHPYQQSERWQNRATTDLAIGAAAAAAAYFVGCSIRKDSHDMWTRAGRFSTFPKFFHTSLLS